MKQNYNELPNGYLESINKGINAVRQFRGGMTMGKLSRDEAVAKLKKEIETADAIVIGAGAGLSTAAGFTYGGERFEKYFGDFARKYGIRDMYSGGFYPFPDAETRWAWWARHIYYNRYVPTPKPVYQDLLKLLENKDYFVITTNVDHQFQAAGFDKKRLFYTQGDYGLFQSVNPQIRKTYDNEVWVMAAMEAQGFVRDSDNIFQPPQDGPLLMRIPTELIPKCPDDGSDVTMNLRADDSFVEDEGWHRASAAYSDFLGRHENLHVLYLEIGIRTVCFVSPVFPGITDFEAIFERVKDQCDLFWLENLNLRGGFKKTIMDYIAGKHPELMPLYDEIYNKKNRSYFEALEKKAEEMAKKYDCPFVDNEMPYGRVSQGHPVIVDYFYHEEIRGSDNTGKRNKD